MSFLLLRIAGVPFVAISGGKIEDAEKHVFNGYPDMAELIGQVTAEVVSDLSGVVFSPPPETSRSLSETFMRKSFLVAFSHENRVRVLEGKPPVTKAQFRIALDGMA